MILLKPFQALRSVAGVFGTDKSFIRNPIIGNERLNKMGLHKARVSVASRMAAHRRSRMRRISPEDRAAFDRDGFIVKENFLPEEVFERVRQEVFGQSHRAFEQRQGQTVTRQIMLPPSASDRLPATLGVMSDKGLARLAGLAAGRTGCAIQFIQTVIADPAREKADPQTSLHADTFHSTCKYWLFLHDVRLEDGPFIFVPGSHKLTPERLAWEHQQALSARNVRKPHHSDGSFRITAQHVEALGYSAPRALPVAANTLVVADTFGFHSRSPSAYPTIRTALHGYLRRNPFIPWNGFDALSLPGIKGRQFEADLLLRRISGGRNLWTEVSSTRADGPAAI